MLAVAASGLGDFAGYGIGRMLSQQFLENRGQWIGYTPERRARVHGLFDLAADGTALERPGMVSRPPFSDHRRRSK